MSSSKACGAQSGELFGACTHLAPL